VIKPFPFNGGTFLFFSPGSASSLNHNSSQVFMPDFHSLFLGFFTLCVVRAFSLFYSPVCVLSFIVKKNRLFFSSKPGYPRTGLTNPFYGATSLVYAPSTSFFEPAHAWTDFFPFALRNPSLVPFVRLFHFKVAVRSVSGRRGHLKSGSSLPDGRVGPPFPFFSLSVLLFLQSHRSFPAHSWDLHRF